MQKDLRRTEHPKINLKSLLNIEKSSCRLLKILTLVISPFFEQKAKKYSLLRKLFVNFNQKLEFQGLLIAKSRKLKGQKIEKSPEILNAHGSRLNFTPNKLKHGHILSFELKNVNFLFKNFQNSPKRH